MAAGKGGGPGGRGAGSGRGPSGSSRGSSGGAGGSRGAGGSSRAPSGGRGEWSQVDRAPAKRVPDGVTLETIVTELVTNYGWERLGDKIRIDCFNKNPSIKSSLTFLRKTPWAREKVEQLWLWRTSTGWDPRDNAK